MKSRIVVSVFRESAIGTAVAAAALLLTGCAVVGLFGADSVARLSTWKELGCGVSIYVVALSAVLLVCRVRGRRAAVCTAFPLALIFAVCVVFVCGKGLLPKRLGDPLAAPANGLDIVAAARSQIGVTVKYDPSYVKIGYPGGDVPRDRGVCSDVVIRALRDARGMDLQKLVHEDMEAHYLLYPSLTRWMMFKPDASIDHRRVLNLERFFERVGWSLKVTQDPAAYLPGDIVTCLIGGDLPHIMIVSDVKSQNGTPLVIHNVGEGTQEEDRLFAYDITGHHRVPQGATALLSNVVQRAHLSPKEVDMVFPKEGGRQP